MQVILNVTVYHLVFDMCITVLWHKGEAWLIRIVVQTTEFSLAYNFWHYNMFTFLGFAEQSVKT